MGAWIEIPFMLAKPPPQPSLLSWERGLKLIEAHYKFESFMVAPLVGAWIEILFHPYIPYNTTVAPLVGAWIEIVRAGKSKKKNASLLSWERGLKLCISHDKYCCNRRSSRGSVD